MSSSSTLSLDHHHLTSSSSEQLCYVHCNFCDTVLAVSVPCTSLFKMVTVRCGHCTNLLPVNMRGLLLPSPNPLHHFGGHSFFSPSSQNFLDQISGPTPNFLMNQTAANVELALPPHMGFNDLPKPPVISRILKELDVSPPSRVYFTKICSKRSVKFTLGRRTYIESNPEKRQRIPSAYNRFIKEEIQRIKAGNPDISHREAFSAAAKNWAHFPHIQFGLMPDQPVKKSNVRQQENEDHVLMKDGGFFSTANIGV